MAVYKRDRRDYFQQAVDSCLCDQFSHLVLVVDGPVDSQLRELIYRMACAPRCHVISLPTNRGLAGALNAGISYILESLDAELVSRIDADDYNDLSRSRSVLDEYRSKGGDILYTDYYEIVGESVDKIYQKRCLDVSTDFSKLAYRSLFPHVCVTFTRSFLERQKGPLYDETSYLNEDIRLWMRLILGGDVAFMHVHKRLVHVRATSGQVLRLISLKQIVSTFRLRMQYIREVKVARSHKLVLFIILCSRLLLSNVIFRAFVRLKRAM
jgi:glycosyltransferase involved in cell wall biosynthesis